MFESINTTAQHMPSKCSRNIPMAFLASWKVQCAAGAKKRQAREVSRSVVCMVQRVKTEGKAPFPASRHVVSDLWLWGNKRSLEVESHGKNLLHHKALWSKGNRAEALVLAIV